MIIGKALGNGYPISAVLGSRELMDLWPLNAGEALHTGTFTGHGESVLAAHKIVQEYLYRIDSNWMEQHSKNISQVLLPLKAVGRGFCYRIPVDNAGQVMKKLLQEKIIALPADSSNRFLSYVPPLTTSLEEVQKFVSVMAKIQHEK